MLRQGGFGTGSSAVAALCVIASILGLSACGYSIRRGQSEALDQDGVRKVYVAPVVNDTYRYGVENAVYNALIRSLGGFSGIKVVSDPEMADAVLSGRVIQADSVVSGTSYANNLQPGKLPVPLSFGSMLVATVYNAILSCEFKLNRRDGGPLRPAKTVWSGNFSRSRLYPASNQLGVLGTTSGLINDSEFDRTIVDVSHDMMVDVREAIVSRF